MGRIGQAIGRRLDASRVPVVYHSRKLAEGVSYKHYPDLIAARLAPQEIRLFCLVLSLSGGRISEILAPTPAAIDIDSGVANITTLKRRKLGIVRQVPLPRGVLVELNQVFHLRRSQRDPNSAAKRIWKWNRTTAWRRVKEVFAVANVSGTPAMPKGLRHSVMPPCARPLSMPT
jgi:integrase